MQSKTYSKKHICEHYAVNSIFVQHFVGTIEKWTKINVHFFKVLELYFFFI